VLVVVVFGVPGSGKVTLFDPGDGFPSFREFLGASHPDELPNFDDCINSIFSTHTILSTVWLKLRVLSQLNNSSRLVRPSTDFYRTTRIRK
jgi:hypothetical protein